MFNSRGGGVSAVRTPSVTLALLVIVQGAGRSCSYPVPLNFWTLVDKNS